jgi:hypothetical protein
VFFGCGDFSTAPKLAQFCGERCEHADEHSVVAEADSALAKGRGECSVIEILRRAKELGFQVLRVALRRGCWGVARLAGVFQSGPKCLYRPTIWSPDSWPRRDKSLDVSVRKLCDPPDGVTQANSVRKKRETHHMVFAVPTMAAVCPVRLNGSITLLPDSDDVGGEPSFLRHHLHGKTLHALKVPQKCNVSNQKIDNRAVCATLCLSWRGCGRVVQH